MFDLLKLKFKVIGIPGSMTKEFSDSNDLKTKGKSAAASLVLPQPVPCPNALQMGRRVVLQLYSILGTIASLY